MCIFHLHFWIRREVILSSHMILFGHNRECSKRNQLESTMRAPIQNIQVPFPSQKYIHWSKLLICHCCIFSIFFAILGHTRADSTYISINNNCQLSLKSERDEMCSTTAAENLSSYIWILHTRKSKAGWRSCFQLSRCQRITSGLCLNFESIPCTHRQKLDTNTIFWSILWLIWWYVLGQCTGKCSHV